uniref:Putative molybdenum cofactor sulfurase n=1 Tax=Nyssomyia neivai TaxID=330878 RepID=A0A1L8DZE8_9DIPT
MDAFKEEYSIHEWQNILSEFHRIKEHYLDHAGTTLYSEKQIEEAYKDLSQNVYSNPHTSKSTEDLIDQVRSRILDHFNTDSSSYHVIFTSGTTASLKIVAESFDFSGENSQFCYLRDSHTSVLGMRELVGCAKISSIEKCELLSITKSANNHIPKANNSKSLLVFPAQCNFNGFKYPLKIIERFHSKNLPENFHGSEWYICLDAASFVATNYLNLGIYNPDFVCISFYKIFGYPTGLGALLVNKRAEHVLKKRYYGGGTVKIAMSQINFHEKRDSLHERFEDGTISFLSILSLLHGFNTLQRLVPYYKNGMKTMERISKHTFNLVKYLRNRLAALKHYSGKNVVILYADTDYSSNKLQGGIVNFNVLHSDGSFVGFAEFSYMATIFNITIRTGCFCNPGACQRHLELSNKLVKEQFQAGHICGDTNDLINGIPTGSIRASVGYMTGLANVNALINMIEKCYCRESRIVDINCITEVYKTLPRAKSKNIKIKMICIYPIKSCGAYKIYDEWTVTSYGLQYDRDWMIVTEKGVALTQKINTMMCLIKPHIDKILQKNDSFLSRNGKY